MSKRSIRWRRAARAWLQVAKGEVSLGDETLKAGDAAAITDQAQIAVRSRHPAKCCCLIWLNMPGHGPGLQRIRCHGCAARGMTALARCHFTSPNRLL